MIRRTSLGILIGICIIFSSALISCSKEEPPKSAQQEAKTTEGGRQGLFNAQIHVDSVPEAAKAGTKLKLPVKVKNTSDEIWPAKGPESVRLSYHWLDAGTSKSVVWDGKRTFLSKDVAPAEEVVIDAMVETPPTKGNYILEFDLVQEKVAWFGKKGSPTARFNITVQ